MSALLSPDGLEERLRAVGAERYHDKHPFHVLLHSGGCTKAQVQAWALNRYYYQSRIPLKDASILARMDDPALRRAWRQRLVDHDGDRDGEGGIARWLALTDGLGLDRRVVVATRGLLPATRFAVDAYIHFVRERSLLEAIASSLTELFSPGIIRDRIAGMLAHYPFVTKETLAYFTARPEAARRDVEVAMAYVREHATSPETQDAVIRALTFKCDLLWAMLDALFHAYVSPGHRPPGAWKPDERDA
jgi:coenzyme PQQ biosynthesis protein C